MGKGKNHQWRQERKKKRQITRNQKEQVKKSIKTTQGNKTQGELFAGRFCGC
jgi:hypothetical protein